LYWLESSGILFFGLNVLLFFGTANLKK